MRVVAFRGSHKSPWLPLWLPVRGQSVETVKCCAKFLASGYQVTHGHFPCTCGIVRVQAFGYSLSCIKCSGSHTVASEFSKRF